MSSKRPLRVLHLPLTIRWIMDATIKGQHEIGVETERMLISSIGVNDNDEVNFYFRPQRDLKNKMKGYPAYITGLLRYFGHYFKLLIWCDVVHWQYSMRLWEKDDLFKNLDFTLIKLLRKPSIVQFHGMDFRNNLKWSTSNPWWSESFSTEEMSLFTERAATTQKEFAAAGIQFGLSFGMMPSVESKYMKSAHIMERAIDIAQLEKRADYSEREKVVIVHGPSFPQRKGTQYILEAMEEIKKVRNVEFKLLVDMDHDELLREVCGADIAIDQLICGDYGVFAVEAMASGAAVVANICDELLLAYPSALPIANANPLTIKEVILRLIDCPEERVARGKAGPSYAYKVHSIEETAPEILRVYRKVAIAKGKKATVKRIDYHLALCEEKGWKGISHG